MSNPWELRPMRDDDRNYILSSWLRSYSECPEFRGLRRSVYFAIYEPMVKAMLERSTVAVATLPAAPAIVIGWLAVEDDVLHYVLAKPRWRRLGVAKWLLESMADVQVTYTHSPQPGVLAKIPASWTYDPMRRWERQMAA
jgi:GNAT superfamily N-acetyltransferase